jgi:hypothetical protein
VDIQEHWQNPGRLPVDANPLAGDCSTVAARLWMDLS